MRHRVADRGAGEQDRHPVEPGEVPARHQPELGEDNDSRRHTGQRLRGEEEERHHQLGEMVAEDLHPVPRLGQQMCLPAEGAGHRLGLVVVVQGSQVAPLPAAADLDHAGAKLEPEHQPGQQDQDGPRRGSLVGAEEGHNEPGLQQQHLPAEAVKRLPHVDDRHVQQPQRQERQHRNPRRAQLRQAQDDRGGNRHPAPADGPQQTVRVAPTEQGGPAQPAGACQVIRDRQQAALAEESRKLVERGQEGHEVDGGDAALQHLPGELVLRRVKPGRPLHDPHVTPAVRGVNGRGQRGPRAVPGGRRVGTSRQCFAQTLP